MGELDSLCIVVTGATGNLGAVVCKRLLAGGARVFGVDRHGPRAGFLEGAPGKAERFGHAIADLSVEALVGAAFDGAEARFGPLWALVSLAGAWEGGKPLHEAGLDLFDRMIDANLRGCYVSARAAMQRFAKGAPGRGGRIVNVSALSAVSGLGIAGSAAYAAAKLGVVGLTRALAEEGAPLSVRASCIAPGTMRTATNLAAMPGADASKWVPLEDVAEAIAFLASPASAAVSGAVLPLP